jgi:p-aminobenzoyl-glutamate transporter AbgT
MDGKFHLFDSIVKVISSVYETPHKMQGLILASFVAAQFIAQFPGRGWKNPAR